MRWPIFTLRFRTRLALVMLLIMAITSSVLMFSYVQHNRRINSYVAGQTNDLLQVIQVAQARIPSTGDRNQALQQFIKNLTDAGLTQITGVSPTGEVVASTMGQVPGQKIKLKRHRSATNPGPIHMEAELHDIDVSSTVEQRPYTLVVPIIQGDKVLGYLLVRGQMDEVQSLLRHIYLVRMGWILATMLAGMFAIVYLAFRFTKPVDALVAGAQQVAGGNLYVSLPVAGADEMARLAKTFNQMVERLRENRELTERLNEAEKHSLLGRFAATVAHEVRNSLNFINLSIDQIRAKHTGGEERAARELQRNLSMVKDEVARLNRLVNDFLMVGRPSPPAMADCDIRRTLNETLVLVEKQARRQGIDISQNVPADLPMLKADAVQLKTCFLNILTNAIQAMPKGGKIQLAARTLDADGRGRLLELRFADNGPGIPAEDREKVFTPYFSTKTTGFGLGLAITKKIVEDHGGRIYATTTSASGTEMVMELPLPAGSAAEPASAPAA